MEREVHSEILKAPFLYMRIIYIHLKCDVTWNHSTQVSEWHDAPSVAEPEDLQDRKTDQGMYLFSTLGF